MDFNFLASSSDALGAPFEYSHAYIEFLKIGFRIACRIVQGTVRASDHVRTAIVDNQFFLDPALSNSLILI